MIISSFSLRLISIAFSFCMALGSGIPNTQAAEQWLTAPKASYLNKTMTARGNDVASLGCKLESPKGRKSKILVKLEFKKRTAKRTFYHIEKLDPRYGLSRTMIPARKNPHLRIIKKVVVKENGRPSYLCRLFEKKKGSENAYTRLN